MRPYAPGVFRPLPLVAGVTLAATAACVSETGATTSTQAPQIEVTPANATLSVGDSVSLTVTLPPTLEASGASYVSGNTAIAITRPNGWIIAVGRGKTS